LASRSETRRVLVRKANPSEPSALASGGDTLRIASSDVLIVASGGGCRVQTPSRHLLTRVALMNHSASARQSCNNAPKASIFRYKMHIMHLEILRHTQAAKSSFW